MLVIRRRAGESILIGADVQVQVIEVGPTRVKLGITAPGHIPVMRTEAKLTREQNVAAAGGVTQKSLSVLLERFRS